MSEGKMETRYIIRFVVLVFALLWQSCTPLRPETFGPGDIVGVADGMSITLEKARVSGAKLTADFTIDNSHGEKNQPISASMNFSAKDADGNPLALAPCDGPSIEGTVLAGDQRKGQVCWNASKEGAKLKLYYNSKPGDTSSVVWEVDGGSH